MKPFGRRILIEPEQEDNVILSDTDNLALRGTVKEVGPDCKWVKQGDIVYFLDFGVDTIKIKDKKYRFVLETDDFLLARHETSTVAE